MRILIAPDDFTGTLSAVEAAGAMADGWRRAAPKDHLVLRPMSDGGPGFLAVVGQALGGHRLPVVVRGALGDSVDAEVLLVNDTAYVESAQACGRGRTQGRQRRPRGATTYGVGELIGAAVDAGARRVVVGLGGSSSTDAGAGMLAALGARAWDAAGNGVTLDGGGQALADVAHIDVMAVRERLAHVDLIVATDVDSPLCGPGGAARGFAPQKGATAEDVEFLEDGLASFARVCASEAQMKQSRDVASVAGAGAAGGLGFGLMTVGGVCEPGITTVSELMGLAAAVENCDLVLTGEGCFDWQSLRGKVVTGVAKAALAQGKPAIIIAGRVEVGRREMAAIGVTAAYAITDSHPVEPRGDEDSAVSLARRSERVARQWSSSYRADQPTHEGETTPTG